LAPIVIDKTYEYIKDFAGKGLPFLIVEQNVRKVLGLSDYAYVLDLGRNRFEGRGEEIKTSPELSKLYCGGG